MLTGYSRVECFRGVNDGFWLLVLGRGEVLGWAAVRVEGMLVGQGGYCCCWHIGTGVRPKSP